MLSAHALSVLALVTLVLLAGTGAAAGTARGCWPVQVAVLAGATYVSLATETAVPLTFVPGRGARVGGLRLRPRDVATVELAVFTGVVIVVSARGNGPFGTLLADGTLTPDAAGAFTQGYVLAAALVTLPLGIAVHQQERLRAG